MIFPLDRGLTDRDGHLMVPARNFDTFRCKPVWAVYKLQSMTGSVEARITDFTDIAIAKAMADALNRNRTACDTQYFKVFRLADPFLPANQP